MARCGDLDAVASSAAVTSTCSAELDVEAVAIVRPLGIEPVFLPQHDVSPRRCLRAGSAKLSFSEHGSVARLAALTRTGPGRRRLPQLQLLQRGALGSPILAARGVSGRRDARLRDVELRQPSGNSPWWLRRSCSPRLAVASGAVSRSRSSARRLGFSGRRVSWTCASLFFLSWRPEDAPADRGRRPAPRRRSRLRRLCPGCMPLATHPGVTHWAPVLDPSSYCLRAGVETASPSRAPSRSSDASTRPAPRDPAPTESPAP